MEECNVINRIRELCDARAWTTYRLAKESGITYSTLNTMLNKSHAPSIATLSRICGGFGITLAQFFSEVDETVFLSPEQKTHLSHWNALSDQGKKLADTYIQALLDSEAFPR